MIIIISPAKSLDFKSEVTYDKQTIPRFTGQAEKIVQAMQGFSVEELSQLMDISRDLAELNVERFVKWDKSKHEDPKHARQAIFAYSGDVYKSLKETELSQKELNTAQDKLRIISGLYGLLRPLDMIMPYRMEMKTKPGTENIDSLYDFWRKSITENVKKELQSHDQKTLINLASKEYAKAVDFKALEAKIITPGFKEYRNGKYKTIGIYAKKARGLMARFILQNDIEEPEHIKAFDLDRYHLNESLSNEKNWIFTR